MQDEKKLWKASLLLLLIWTVSWTPYALIFLASVTGHRQVITLEMDMLPGRYHHSRRVVTSNCFNP